MTELFYSKLTTIGKNKIANAQITGNQVLITQISVGDSNGQYYEPSESQTDLVNEVWSGAVEVVSLNPDAENQVIIESAIPPEEGPFWVREAGLWDDEGDLIAIAKIAATEKPIYSQGSTKDLNIKIIIAVENADSVSLIINPALVWASREYVDGMAERDMKIYNVNYYGGISQTITASNGIPGYLFFPPGSHDPVADPENPENLEIPEHLVGWFAPDAILETNDETPITVTLINKPICHKSILGENVTLAFVNIEKVPAKLFGVLPGVADCETYLNKAIESVNASGGGELEVMTGEFLFGPDPILLNTSVNIIGQGGRYSAANPYGTLFRKTEAGDLFDTGLDFGNIGSSVTKLKLKGIACIGDTAFASGSGLSGGNLRYQAQLEDMSFVNFKQYGIHLDNCWKIDFNEVYCTGNGINGAYLTGYANDVSFKGGMYNNHTAGSGIKLEAVAANGYKNPNQNIKIDGALIEGNSIGVYNLSSMACNLTSNYFEGNLNYAVRCENPTQFTTTIDQDSGVGTAILYVADTEGLYPQNIVIINDGGAREESGIILSVDAGVSITLSANLAFDHLASDADVVKNISFVGGNTISMSNYYRSNNTDIAQLKDDIKITSINDYFDNASSTAGYRIANRSSNNYSNFVVINPYFSQNTPDNKKYQYRNKVTVLEDGVLQFANRYRLASTLIGAGSIIHNSARADIVGGGLEFFDGTNYRSIVTVLYSTTTPSTGTFNKGDIVLNSNPTANGILLWVCITTGNPGVWVPVYMSPNMQEGSATVNGFSSTPTAFAVTFATAFSSAPTVQATINRTGGGKRVTVETENITTTGFTGYVANVDADSINTNVHWRAILD